MSSEFRGRGNLGAAPALRQVEVGGEQRPVCDMRIYFDRRVPDGEGGFEDRGGFWLDVHLWGPRAVTASRILPKGARVAAAGTLVQHTWTDKESEEERSRLELQADSVDLDLLRVESVTLRRREQRDEENGDAATVAE